MSSLREGHANFLCIVFRLSDAFRRCDGGLRPTYVLAHARVSGCEETIDRPAVQQQHRQCMRAIDAQADRPTRELQPNTTMGPTPNISRSRPGR